MSYDSFSDVATHKCVLFPGYRVQLNIIYQGSVIHYLSDDDFEDSLPSVPAEVDTVNLTWEAGDELVSQIYFPDLIHNFEDPDVCI